MEPLEKIICGTTKHEIQLDTESCGRQTEENCTRTFYLDIPEHLCDDHDNHHDKVFGKLPLLFALHGFGGNAKTFLGGLQPLATEYNFIIVRPEGVQHSWNAKYCCGYSLEKNINDIAFLSQIIDELETSILFDFVSRDMVYGTGFSNGGFMVTYSAHLFRSISPISGYQYDYNHLGGNFNTVPTGILQHHSKDDPVVLFNGCCNGSANTDNKKCCCGISDKGGNQCTSVDQEFTAWAKKVNGCSADTFTTTYIDNDIGVECRSGDGCKSNTTLCVYENYGHFNSKDGQYGFSNVFPLFHEMANFFARDACVMNEGTWYSEQKICSCNGMEQSSLIYCSGGQTSFENISQTEVQDIVNANRTAFVSGGVMLLIALLLISLKRFQMSVRVNWKHNNNLQKKKDRWERLPLDDEDSERDGIELQ